MSNQMLVSLVEPFRRFFLSFSNILQLKYVLLFVTPHFLINIVLQVTRAFDYAQCYRWALQRIMIFEPQKNVDFGKHFLLLTNRI